MICVIDLLLSAFNCNKAYGATLFILWYIRNEMLQYCAWLNGMNYFALEVIQQSAPVFFFTITNQFRAYISLERQVYGPVTYIIESYINKNCGIRLSVFYQYEFRRDINHVSWLLLAVWAMPIDGRHHLTLGRRKSMYILYEDTVYSSPWTQYSAL
jgi:hypothetical protein